METETSWHEWKNMLGKFVHGSRFLGLSEDRINNFSYRLGEFFANHFDPGNREQRLLKELWEQGNEDEKRVLSSLIARMVGKGETH
ncbi:MAG: DUF3243 domain-containing protein [Peptococcaceae bacterium]|nr:DUF3243 domain-containing protein [Peptococcaceae bacterium]